MWAVVIRIGGRRGSGTARSIATLISGNLIAQIIMVLAMPVLSRIYGPAAFGVLAIYTSLSLIVGSISALRYEMALVLPESLSSAKLLRALSTRIVFAFSILTLTVTGLLLWLSPEGWGVQPWMLLVALSVLLVGEASILYQWYTRLKRYRTQSTARVVQAVVTTASQVALGLVGSGGDLGLIWGYLLGQGAAVLYLLLVDPERGREKVRRGSDFRSLAVEYRKLPLLNVPNALVDSIRVNGINFIIAEIASVRSLGQFSMSMRLVQAPVNLISGAISQVFFQKMATVSRGGLASVVKSSVVRSAVLGFVPFLIIASLSPIIVPWVLGPGWEQAGYFAQALTPWLYLNLVSSPISNVFIVARRQGALLTFAVFYMSIPLTILWLFGANILLAVWFMSLTMAVLLIIMIVLAYRVSRRYDTELEG